jgi:transposase
MYILTLTTWQRRQLEQQLHLATDARVYRRTLALLEVGGGESIAAVAVRLRVTARVIYRWIGLYARSHDLAAVRDRDRSGRPRRMTDRGRELLGELLTRSPQDLGGFAAAWTVPLLRRQLARRLRRRPSADTVRRELRRLGYTWKRSRYVLAPDPDAGGKKRAIRRRIRGLPKRSVVLAEDETDLLLFPPLRASWSPKGRPKEVALSGWNGRRVVFGAMNLRTGHRLFVPRDRQRASDFREFLKAVRSAYRGWQVALLLDEDPSHTAKGSVRLAEHLSRGRTDSEAVGGATMRHGLG